MSQEVMQSIEKEKIIAIVRGVKADQCMSVAEALYIGGIRLMEITFDQQKPDSFCHTAEAIGAIGKKFAGKMLIGAGTVLTPEQVNLVSVAGARFIISPDMNREVIRHTKKMKLISIPGAMTPTEIITAHREGADFVKLFPAAELGLKYIKAIKSPISHVKMMAVGGIDEKNMADFLSVGICGFGVGGNLVNKKWIEAGEYSKITDTALMMTKTVKNIA